MAASPRSLLRRRDAILAAVGAFSVAVGETTRARASDVALPADMTSWIARPPVGFVPLMAPGRVVKVEAKGDFASMMQPNQLWPRPGIARNLVERALTDLTGAPNAVDAMRRFVHPQDSVAIKVNGIAGQVGHTMAVNFEVILPVVEAVLGVGVPAEKISVYEQYPTYLMGTRVNVRNWRLPEGVVSGSHNNRDHVMPRVRIVDNIPTRYCRFFTDATAVIDMTQMKDHSLCGFTGALKNITHGNVENPEDHHANQASPQIALLYNHPIVQSRVRLHITDAFKVIYDRGPLDKDPRTRVPHGAIYASTDPVALDTIGYRVIDEERKKRGGMSLKKAGREPRYIDRAGELGIGVRDENLISLREVTI